MMYVYETLGLNRNRYRQLEGENENSLKIIRPGKTENDYRLLKNAEIEEYSIIEADERKR